MQKYQEDGKGGRETAQINTHTKYAISEINKPSFVVVLSFMLLTLSAF